MSYQVATVSLDDLEGHSPVADVFNAIRGTFVQHFTRFHLTVCSHDSSALAELLDFLSYKDAVISGARHHFRRLS